ncbi:hypothetical protein K491DRAFT_28266 [Lophiostoma macrostomum CBS 122681]|uniref:Uncharacterized protein n=1 Tax=Lophiostoma macrostomum CBS 122681 TaxID=1314788 RepID=A0A6A6T127_9PLEO|nr:hypothetical protein K491DRAFT_28266 [Lophiostoma macrostomum CBS 122681]
MFTVCKMDRASPQLTLIGRKQNRAPKAFNGCFTSLLLKWVLYQCPGRAILWYFSANIPPGCQVILLLAISYNYIEKVE